MRPLLTSLLIVALALGAMGCGEDESAIVAEAATVSAGVYANEYFGLTLPLPDGWIVADEETDQYIREAGLDLMASDDEALRSAYEASKETTFQLLMLSEHEMGAPVDFNPNLIIMAERVSHTPGIKSGADYLFHLNRSLMQTQLPYERTKETYPAQIEGQEWYRADFVLRQPEVTVEQSYFAAKKGDFVIVIILSAGDEEQMAALERIAASIEL